MKIDGNWVKISQLGIDHIIYVDPKTNVLYRRIGNIIKKVNDDDDDDTSRKSSHAKGQHARVSRTFKKEEK